MSLTVADLGEKRLLREVVKPLLPTPVEGVGAGDDAAVIPFPCGRPLVASSDKLPEKLLATEFGVMTPAEHGRYLVAVSVSDIAAMGGVPLGVLLTLALPDEFLVDDLREFVAGAVTAGEAWGAPVLGGDTGGGTVPCLSSAAFGSLVADRPLTRTGARPGDVVALSGAIGGFGAALAFFDARTRGAAPQLSAASVSGLRELLVLPEPAIELGPALAACGWCTACMDVTDGLGQSLAEIAEASGVGLDIDADAVPIHPLALEVCDAMGLDRFDVAFGIGLDLKLLVTIAAGEEDRATERGLIPFGRAREAPGLSFHRDGRSEVRLPGRGWQHFGGDARSHIAGRA